MDEKWRTRGAGDSDIVGDTQRTICYAAWTIYRDGQEALGDCADIVDFRTGFNAGYEAGQQHLVPIDET